MENRKFRILAVLLGLCTALCILISTNISLLRMIRHGDSDIEDHIKFATRKIVTHKKGVTLADRKNRIDNADFRRKLADNNTIAYLRLSNDSTIKEEYFEEGGVNNKTLYFSMTKSVMALLIGCAIEDGIISNLEEEIRNYIPDFQDERMGKIKIIELLQMTAPIEYTDSDNPFGRHAKLYYTSDVEKELLKLNVEEEKKHDFMYKSCNYALLGLLLKRALGKETVATYLERRVWIPLEMQAGAEWIIDQNNGLEKTWCCLAGTARDYSKIVSLYMNKGKYKDKQIVASEWINKTLEPLNRKDEGVIYNMGWWIYPDKGIFAAIGKDGQFAIGEPNERIITIRLGKGMGKLSKNEWLELLR